MLPDRQRMCQRRSIELIDLMFIVGIKAFVEFAKAHLNWNDGQLIRCPCNQKKFEWYVGDENMSAFETMIHDAAASSFQLHDIEDTWPQQFTIFMIC